ncbi:hypothetical protein TNCV_4600821 [Trichonephila clavipes]|nr:hypothetical protein TNCV_4600821 [Trichonephila clavipes]
MTSHNRLDDFLRWRTICSLKLARFERKRLNRYKWSAGCGINSKQEVLLSGRSAKGSPQSIKISTGSLPGFKRTTTLVDNGSSVCCLEEEFSVKRTAVV